MSRGFLPQGCVDPGGSDSNTPTLVNDLNRQCGCFITDIFFCVNCHPLHNDTHPYTSNCYTLTYIASYYVKWHVIVTAVPYNDHAGDTELPLSPIRKCTTGKSPMRKEKKVEQKNGGGDRCVDRPCTAAWNSPARRAPLLTENALIDSQTSVLGRPNLLLLDHHPQVCSCRLSRI